MTVLLDVLRKWKDIGGSLGVRQGKMEEIDHDQRGSARECMRYTILEWLHGNAEKPVTWMGLIRVLKSALVEATETADKIIKDIVEKVHTDIN